jgi:SAM-dependent methyltransferase
MNVSNSLSVLELACGIGNLADLFSPEIYLGIDIAADRITVAQKEHPEYRFQVCDSTSLEFKKLVKDFDFIFCHGLLHHLGDQQCRALLDGIRFLAKKPTTLVGIEPILPLSWQNPFGFLLAKLDQGRYIRRPQGYRQLFGDCLLRTEELNFFPRWPVREQAYIVKFL